VEMRARNSNQNYRGTWQCGQSFIHVFWNGKKKLRPISLGWKETKKFRPISWGGIKRKFHPALLFWQEKKIPSRLLGKAAKEFHPISSEGSKKLTPFHLGRCERSFMPLCFETTAKRGSIPILWRRTTKAFIPQVWDDNNNNNPDTNPDNNPDNNPDTNNINPDNNPDNNLDNLDNNNPDNNNNMRLHSNSLEGKKNLHAPVWDNSKKRLHMVFGKIIRLASAE